MGGEIPVIDLQGNEAGKLRKACEKWGCFRVVNHGVPTDLMAEIKSVSLDLFDRTVEVKQRNKKLLPGSGYVALNEVNQIYEALAIDVTSSQCIPSFCSDLDASPLQREIIEKYYVCIQNLAKDVASKMAESMGLVDDGSFQVKPSHFRINKYTITPENIDSGGLTKHTDSSLVTILQDDENFGGLEVVDPCGDIVAVECYPGAFVVLLGDIALPWSNGKLRNVEHRVVCKDTGIRLSIATICTPANDEVIVAHPKFLAGDCQPKYKPFTYEEFRKLRASEKMFSGEVLELLRVSNN